jgi:hypothetical protein
VVCSRYERERKPLSLIRTCQELVARIPTARKSVWISKAIYMGLRGRFENEQDRIQLVMYE